MKVTLKALGNVSDEIMEGLRNRISGVFHCPIEIGAGSSDLARAYNPQRKQYSSSKLLSSLEKSERDERVAGITDVDLYVPGLNFVFGEADTGSGTTIISLCRLRQEYYGLAPDQELFWERAAKEVVHEIGHTFGLGHCSNNKCVMHFSNSLADTDLKEVNFCDRCRPRLEI